MSGAVPGSRIVLSGSVGEADGLRRLAWAIRSDGHRNGRGARDLAGVIELLEPRGGGPLVLHGAGRGEIDFHDVRQACRRLGVSFLHEFPDGRLGRVDCHVPALAPSSPTMFWFNGTISHPAIDVATYADAHAYDDAELGAAVRREFLRIEKAVELAASPFGVDASALDELRNASGPARGRGLL